MLGNAYFKKSQQKFYEENGGRKHSRAFTVSMCTAIWPRTNFPQFIHAATMQTVWIALSSTLTELFTLLGVSYLPHKFFGCFFLRFCFVFDKFRALLTIFVFAHNWFDPCYCLRLHDFFEQIIYIRLAFRGLSMANAP